MQIDFEVTSVEGFERVVVFRRGDGDFGYAKFRNVGDAVNVDWQEDGPCQWGFGSGTSAMLKARTLIDWLRRELDWPAKEFAPQTVAPFKAGWLECPAC